MASGSSGVLDSYSESEHNSAKACVAEVFVAILLASLIFSTSASFLPFTGDLGLLQPSPTLFFLLQPLLLQPKPNEQLLVFPCYIAKQVHFRNGWGMVRTFMENSKVHTKID